MQISRVLKFSALCAAIGASAVANAGIVNDTNITGNVFFGTGNANGGFSVATDNGVEIGLRARVRYPTPSGATNVQAGTNVYNHVAGGFTTNNYAGWNFDWSINTGVGPVSGLRYQIGIDFDAGLGVNFQTFDLINGVNPNPDAGGLALWDHSFGSTSTLQSQGVEATGATLAESLSSYQTLAASNSVVQNSWNLGFFDNASYTFDPTANGQYTIFLRAIGANDQELTRSTIEVVVGTGAAVPEPTSLALIGLALGCLAATRRRA